MSMTLNMVYGAGGKLKDTDAILNVTLPTGSTVTITKGGVTLTPTIWVKNANASLDCALFIIPSALFDAQNAWTINASLGTATASKTITISAAKEYEIEIVYSLYIFYNGVRGVTLDVVRSNTSDNSTATMSNSGTNLYMYIKYNSGGTGATYQYGTSGTVDVTKYSKMSITLAGGSGWANTYVGVYNTKTGTFSQNASAYADMGGSATSGTTTINTTNITGNKYIAVRMWTGTGGSRSIYISKWVLEQ